jgi:hypothetical protein
MDTLGAQARLLGAQGGIVHHANEGVERLLMAQPFELHAGRRAARVAAVLHQVAAAELDGVEAEGAGGQIDQALRYGGGNRMPDGAILAGRRLVLEHHRGLGAEVGEVIGAADQVDDLVALHGAGARIHRIRADAG